MTKAKEEWTARSNYVKFGPDDGMEHVGHADVFTVKEGDRAKMIRRIAAVPDYEAALKALLPEGMTMAHDKERHTAACWKTGASEPCLSECEQVRAALRKGGVL